MALSTKNIPAAGISKTFKPGNVFAKLNNITYETDKFNDGGLIVKVHIEGADLGESFEGFFKDPDNQTKGRYKGQIGTVAAGQYSFKDAEVNGRKIERDVEILKFISTLGKSIGKDDEINSLEANSIEEYIEMATKVLCSKDAWLHWCLGGKEYEKAGYTNYSLFLVKNDFKQKKYSFGTLEDDVIKYDAAKHIVRKKKEAVETVEQFEPVATDDFDIPGLGADEHEI
ncbi:MAG TPA: hypothetical protein VGM30_10385 [Puia sp.]|jgi:hypothetical protein